MSFLNALNRAIVSKNAFQSWISHVEQCDNCAEQYARAKDLEGEERDSIMWQMGFNGCLDMIEAGQLRKNIPAEPEEN